MFAGHSQRLLQVAAAETLGRIERDRERAPRRITPLLAYIGEHLFDPSLDVNQLKRGCGVRDNSLPIQFHAALGRPPHAYIETCRLEIACRLLRQSDLKVWKIAELIGYSSIQVFSRAFTRWAGLRPTAYRKDPSIELNPWDDGEETVLVPSTPMSHGARPFDLQAETASFRLALDGKLGDEEIRPLLSRLVALYPMAVAAALREGEISAVQDHRTASPWLVTRDLERLPFSAEELQKIRAEEVWAAIRSRPRKEQRDFVRKSARFDSSALFELLQAKSIELGRDNRQYGVELAQLALDSLEALVPPSGARDRLPFLVSGWLGLSTAHRLALELREAEKALAVAEEHLDRVPDNPRLQADALQVKASLRWNQRRFEDAIGLADKAIEIYREREAGESLAKALILRGITFDAEDQLEASSRDLEEAIGLLEGNPDSYTLFSAYQALAWTKLQQGELEELARLLPIAQTVGREAGLSEVYLRLRWLEGLVARELDRPEAEAALVETREGFLAVGRGAEAAASSLDLACHLFEQGRQREVMDLAAEVVVLYEALEIRRDALAALSLLREATRANRLTQAILERARGSLAEGSNAPAIPLRAKQRSNPS